MHSGDNRHGGSERDGDLESDGYSSMTDYPSEDGEVQQLLSQLLAPSDGSDGAAQGGTTALAGVQLHWSTLPPLLLLQRGLPPPGY